MRKPRIFLQMIISSGMVFLLQAHLVKTSLSIKGDELFTAGETVTLKWDIMINHYVPHRIYFSSAAGQPWQLIDSIPETSGKKAMTYTWTVPQVASTSARIRIFQSFVSKPGDQTDDYTIVSKDFTITKPTTKVITGSYNNNHSRSQYGIQNRKLFDISGRLINQTFIRQIVDRKIIGRHLISHE
jgi:hypothetical protein